MPRFRKKPVEIEAIQWTGDNLKELEIFTDDEVCPLAEKRLLITTLEGEMKASLNDWIIKGVQGEFYPCKPDIFEATYEHVPETVPGNRPPVTIGNGYI